MAQSLNNLLDNHLDLTYLREPLHLSLLDLSIQIVSIQKLKDHAKMLPESELGRHIYNSVRMPCLHRIGLLEQSDLSHASIDARITQVLGHLDRHFEASFMIKAT